MNRYIEKGVIAGAWLCGILLFAALGGILFFLFINGAAAIRPKLLFGTTPVMDALMMRKEVFQGLFPALVGTVLLVFAAVVLAMPVGLASGIYLAEYGRGRWKMFFGLFCDMLAGIPSILIGLFGFSVAIILHKKVSSSITPCLLISAFSLSILVLPYFIRTTQTALENIPEDVRMTGLALGATRLQNIFFVLIPRALSGITSGAILSLGRCAEDTAVIMLTGAVAMAGIPRSLLAKYEALPFFIYYISAQYADKEELQAGYGSAVILLFICAGLYGGAFLIKRRLAERMLYKW